MNPLEHQEYVIWWFDDQENRVGAILHNGTEIGWQRDHYLVVNFRLQPVTDDWLSCPVCVANVLTPVPAGVSKICERHRERYGVMPRGVDPVAYSEMLQQADYKTGTYVYMCSGCEQEFNSQFEMSGNRNFCCGRCQNIHSGYPYDPQRDPAHDIGCWLRGR